MITRQEQVSLLPYNTFGMDVKADWLVEYDTPAELREVLQSDLVRHHEHLVVGEGSNLLFLSDFRGVVIRSRYTALSVLREEDGAVYVEAGSGLVWDDLPVMLGVEPLQLALDERRPPRAVLLLPISPRGGIDGGQVVNAVAHRIDIHHRPAHQQHKAVRLEQLAQQPVHVQFELPAVVLVMDGMRADEVVTRRLQLPVRRGSRADAQLAVELARVRRDDGSCPLPRQPDADARLAHAGGSYDDE